MICYVWIIQVRIGYVRLGQVRSGNDRLHNVMSCS
jgi:hypothetical protein